MSNIGYAVFGSPKGISVLSNGLFKELNIDKSLYLNSSHVLLEKGQQVLMVRRIPSSLQNSEKKDAILIVLYEHALQHGENRAGGFVGSAICFKDKMPNAEKMISGLMYLFSKMKENVDGDNRFKSTDASNWNITLPDANKEFGLENNRLAYASISASSKNIVIKLNNLEKETVSLLYNFALNRSFHAVDYLYASTNNTVAEKLKSNGFSQIAFAELFNYDKHLNYYKDRLVKDNEKLHLIKSKLNTDSNLVKRLESDIITKRGAVEKIDKEISIVNKQLKQAVNKKNEAQRELDELKRLGNTNSNLNRNNNKTRSNEDSEKVIELKAVLNGAAIAIEEIENTNSSQNSSANFDEKNKRVVKDYFNELPQKTAKKQKVIIGIFAAVLILLIAFVTLFIWKSYNFNKYIKETQQKEQIVSNENAEVEKGNRKSDGRLKKLKNLEKGNLNFDYKAFKQLAEVLLNEHLAEQTNEKEKSYINDERAWEFFEFDFTNDKLVDKLKPASKSDNLISIDNTKHSRRIYTKYKWNGKDKLKESLQKYLEESNDIYEYLEYKEVLNDKDLIESHYEWLIKEVNKVKDLKDLEEKKTISLPFYDPKK